MTHVAPSTLCARPELWSYWGDGMGGVELEVAEFVESLVVLMKPKLIVETGAYTGTVTAALARGCERVGIGHVWSYEIVADRVERAREFLRAEGLLGRVTIVEADATKAEWEAGRDEGGIDLLVVDGGTPRAAEIRSFERHLSARAVIVAHDAYDAVHGWATLASDYRRVVLPTPLGLALFQARSDAIPY